MFNSMFGMIGTCNSRKIDLFEDIDFTISTIKNTDSPHPYETAVLHKDFNDNHWIIVEEYDSAEAAKIGHQNWILKMKSDSLTELTDISSAEATSWRGGPVTYKKQN